MTRRALIGVGAVAVVVVTIALATTLSSPSAAPAAHASAGNSTDPSGPATAPSDVAATATPLPTARPIPRHEVFGFVPYWEMNDGIAEHLQKTPLTTLALFSVTHTKDGTLDTKQTGYKRITGGIGKRLIREAHERGTAVQLTYTSFGTARNERFFTSPAVQDKTIAALVALAQKIGVDGIDVDVERVDVDLAPAYGAFVGRLREALRAKLPDAQVSIATTSGPIGGAMARAAADAGVDRIFMMAYDYHYAGSEVGASAPMDRRDGAAPDLVWSLDLYESLGVPVERTILGLPLYGMRWRVAGPELGAPRLGDGAIWVPADNPRFLADPPRAPELDPIEIVEFYAVAPTVSAAPGDSRAIAGWQAIYVDSPRTLAPKLKLADERGLAGAGFWAIGYERGLAGYRDLITTFKAGKLE
jgi:Glycosyl hydrolases family 18